MNFLKAMFGNYSKREVKRVQPICDKVLALEDKYAAMSESELKNQTTILKERLANGETTDDILPEAFATCREAPCFSNVSILCLSYPNQSTKPVEAYA